VLFNCSIKLGGILNIRRQFYWTFSPLFDAVFFERHFLTLERFHAEVECADFACVLNGFYVSFTDR